MSSNTVYIPSKGRPECLTAQYLVDIGYPSDWFIVVGDDDETAAEYIENFGDEHVIIFDKDAYAVKTDLMDAWHFDRPTGVAPARNFIAEHARLHGLKRFWLFDDDYKSVSKRVDDGEDYEVTDGGELFRLFDQMEQFGERTSIPVVGFLARDWTKGICSRSYRVYNGHNIATEGFWKFAARMFDDSVHAMTGMRRGKPDFGFHHMYINLAERQFKDGKSAGKVKGGMADVYDEKKGYGNGEKRKLAKVRDAGYQIIASPSGIRLTFKKDDVTMVHRDAALAPRLISERFAISR